MCGIAYLLLNKHSRADVVRLHVVLLFAKKAFCSYYWSILHLHGSRLVHGMGSIAALWQKVYALGWINTVFLHMVIKIEAIWLVNMCRCGVVVVRRQGLWPMPYWSRCCHLPAYALSVPGRNTDSVRFRPLPLAR